MFKELKLFLSGVLSGLFLMGGAVIGYNNYFRANYEEVTAYYSVKPRDTLWDVSHQYYLEDDRKAYFLQFLQEVLDDNPRINANGGQIRPGDMIKIRFYRKVDR